QPGPAPPLRGRPRSDMERTRPMPLSRILLAAPDSPALAPHRAFLTRLGYDVAVCGDGLGCADRLRRDRPDVLVLALDLPWGRGEGVLALIAEGELPAVPVV